MMQTLRSLRELGGDALIAIGEKLGGYPGRTFPTPAPWVPAVDANPVTRYVTAAKLDPRETRSALLDELSDSGLLTIAATVIAGWKPTDVDVLVDALRDRAAQFSAAETEAYEQAERLRNRGQSEFENV